MSLTQFIKDNREEIDTVIKNAAPGGKLNDSERRLWILNDEGLYNWARLEGVNV